MFFRITDTNYPIIYSNPEMRLQRHYMNCYYILLTIIVIILSACSTVSVRFDSNPILLDNIPFYPQEEYQCGPASLASVLNYWGVNVTPDNIAKEIYSESARGTLTIDMIIYVQKKGLNATTYKGSMEDLKKNVDSGYPVIVFVDYGISLYQVNHFMVVIGYSGHGVIVNSGKDKGKFISEEDFTRAWERTKYWTLLIKPL